MKEFAESASLRKDELERALRDREWLKREMRVAYENGNEDRNWKNSNQIRVMGDIDFVLNMVKWIPEMVKDDNDVKSIGVMKLEKDKKDRKGDFSPTHLRAYINMRD